MPYAPKSVLVPVDVENAADAELTAAFVAKAGDFASELDARITLLHVLRPVVVSSSFVQPLELHAVAEAERKARHDAASANLARLTDDLRSRGLRVEVALVEEVGSVAHVIVDEAERRGVDMIVIGTHARGRLKRAVLGSVADQTAHISTVPVLLFPPTFERSSPRHPEKP